MRLFPLRSFFILFFVIYFYILFSILEPCAELADFVCLRLASELVRESVLLLELDEIWVVARRKERLEELAEKCRTKIRPIALDLGKRENFAVLKKMLEAETPDIRVLVNAAGFGLFGVFKDMDMDKQLDIIELNDRALTAVTYMAIPYMSKGSHIINMASNSSWQPVPYINVYGASKDIFNFSS